MTTTKTILLAATALQTYSTLLESADVGQLAVNKQAEKEIDRRANIVVRALNDLKSAQKNLADISKPDVKTYTTPGDESTAIEGYSAGRNKQIEDAKKRADAIETAINLMLEAGADFAAAEEAYLAAYQNSHDRY